MEANKFYCFISRNLTRHSSGYIIIIMSRRQNPNDFLKQIIGRPVVVKLNSGVDYRGKILQQYTEMIIKIQFSRCSDLS